MSATMIRTVISRPSTMGAIRTISNSSKANSAATLAHNAAEAGHYASSGSTAKTVAYTALGTVAVVGGLSALLKDEVIYWTPNARK
ncbi:hypothetical protein BGZ73_004253 [Actinomortierella ambigua]|nr:hypothetical protein BGZ73_004253 [Actinomortierella ambigua]